MTSFREGSFVDLPPSWSSPENTHLNRNSFIWSRGKFSQTNHHTLQALPWKRFYQRRYCNQFFTWEMSLKLIPREMSNLLILNYVPTRQQDVVATSLRRPSVCPSNVAVTSQMKHPTTSPSNIAKTSQWYVSTTSCWNVLTTSQEDVTTTSHQCVSSTSRLSLKWNTQRRLSGTSPRRLSGTYPWCPISTSLRRLL